VDAIVILAGAANASMLVLPAIFGAATIGPRRSMIPIEIFTIGFGLDGSNDIDCVDNAAPWSTRTATDLLVDMATDPE
jgi:hypothetical protein